MNFERLAAALQDLDTPVALFATGDGLATSWSAAHGVANAATGQPLTADTPLRVASNTKTFVAAALMRLSEQRRIDLDAPADASLDRELVALLADAGYRPSSMTLRQLASHSAGLPDHADENYLRIVLANPARRWSRAEQVGLGVGRERPSDAPGTRFRYSDTGYLLLGDAIERATGWPLAHAVRRLLRFDALGLASTWWEDAEAPPAGVAPRAHQSFGGVDVTHVDPTMDLYGGGGLVMTARDLAAFMRGLFEGRVFDARGTLDEMLRPGPHAGADGYRIGLAAQTIAGRPCYSHAGFWGTVACYVPALRIAIAGFTTSRETRTGLVSLIEAALGDALREPAIRPGA
ncbi:serine hydrolase domain-containing protein [Burkholderia pseudomultivorans]|uniref:D-alanyl-D-alanine carboxypeptidase n=1 Tax=Burkholderia pseudomultivorans TaxID=1207504 RepID=A0A6P2IR52_9BURK|nr:serine hydrolase domain-containing protein [Burkholderia pseudomultivorans]MDR8726933.1 D-alanyl-D-alanine carboxypeptidase [Burkholderia pseudomultivorans]MDR8735902.1 D-alanyl-D-alanine carboxypeptidase [Burkholderia pseudomultivorans]MDR8741878.1 D-alanyl-D-alanine carboxypeptidase [Burkholderia pseudomultivorans]MDR8752692.1 D-alanyl-D-alanine carboxypeptidase [Burkholderia pseudomultivorans]MDR8778472.1 D-alanyl-D-alanine carboxypeptidase [Burkholderia pseudomultivorans]